MSFDKCFGILSSLQRKHGAAKLESAAEYALRINAPTYRMLKAVLEAVDLPQQLAIPTLDTHSNIRGANEYAQ